MFSKGRTISLNRNPKQIPNGGTQPKQKPKWWDTTKTAKSGAKYIAAK